MKLTDISKNLTGDSLVGHLLEAPTSLAPLKKAVIKQVEQSKDVDLLDQIYQYLTHHDVKDKISTAFIGSAENGNLPNVSNIINDMINYIKNLEGTSKEKMDFVELLQAGKVVNTKELLAPASSFEKIIANPFARRFFRVIANYGQGQNAKGPGEFALAILSPEIALAEKGDLLIGNQHVEVKAAVGAQGNGGRLGEPGIMPTPESVIAKCKESLQRNLGIDAEQVEVEFEKLMGGRKSKALTACAMYLSKAYSPKVAQSVIADLASFLFGDESAGKAVGKAVTKSPAELEGEYMKQNYLWYQKRDGFDTILSIFFAKSVTLTITADNIAELRKKGILKAPAVSIIQGQSREAISQISLGIGK